MSQVAAIHARDKRRCWICARSVALPDATRDHVKPRGEGGYNKARNYRLAHAACNAARGRLPVEEVDRLRAVLTSCSAEVLRQAIRKANAEYMRSDVARERLAAAPPRPEVRYREAKAGLRSSRRAAKHRRREANDT